MAKRSNQKLKLLYLSKILIENTDERHGLTLSQIINELLAYGVEAGRKSLYDDMEALRVYGIDIRTKRDRYVKYYVHNRKFDAAELRLVLDMVAENRLLSEKKSRELIKKLQDLNGKAKIDYADFSQKSYSDDAYNNINLICKAIDSCNKITFRCFDWNSRKQRILVSDGVYFTVSPCKLIFKNGGYFLLGFNHKSQKMESFNLERIINLSMLKSIASKENCDTSVENTHVFNIRLKCDKSVAGEVFDRFGLGVTVLSDRDEYFDIAVKTEINDEFFAWLFTKGTRISILSPIEVAEKYQEMLLENLSYARETVNEKER